MFQVILNFHGIGPIDRTMDIGEQNCWIDQDYFEEVLDLVKAHENVRLTFDDGNVSDVNIALPSLLKHNLRAIFFICTSRIDQPTFLKQTEVRQLAAHGMSIGNHGMNHVSWRLMDVARLEEELLISRQVLGKIIGSQVEVAACPFGAYDRIVLSALRRTGYRFIYTSDGGNASEGKWIQPRNTVTRSMSLKAIQDLVRRGTGVWKQVLIDVRSLAKSYR